MTAPAEPGLRGCLVAMVTPFSADGGLDLDGLRRNVDWLIAEGVHGLIPSGSAGEFLQLRDEERADLIATTIDQAAGRVPVVAGVTSDWTAEVVSWARFARDAGAAAIMVAPPFYSLPDEDEVFAHYRAVSEASDLPVMVYNNPATTGLDLTPAVLGRLSALPTLRYVKESTRDVRRIAQIAKLAHGRMQVFAGIHALESLLVGAAGWVSVPANVLPAESAQLFEAAAASELDRARVLDARLWEIMELEDETGKYVQVYKRALELMGRPAGAPRSPRLPLNADEERRLIDILDALGLLAAPAR